MDLTKQAQRYTAELSDAIAKLDLGDVAMMLQVKLDQLDTTLTHIARHMHHQHARHQCERDVMRTELHLEAVDREANSARVMERQRFLFERSSALPGQADASDRANASAAYVESALSALCPHAVQPTSGCEALATSLA